MSSPLFSIKVKNLKTAYKINGSFLNAVDGVDLGILEGEVVGLAGESACGKSTLAYSILRLLPANGEIINGEIFLGEKNLINMSDNEFRKIRWKEMSIVFQGSMNALNPCMTTIDQINEAILAHEEVTKEEATARSIKLIREVGIAERFIESYPHELSGGMKQRVVIAMALACEPKVLFADEPTTALDLIAQKNIIDVMKEIQERMNLSVLLISHDLSVIAQMAHRCAIMYAGKIVEFGDTATIFHNGLHPYTKALIGAFPDIRSDKEISGIPGDPPDLINPPSGCRFNPRCPLAADICRRTEPELEEKNGRPVACHMVE